MTLSANAELIPEDWNEIEEQIRIAGQYVRPSDDRRPLVLEGAHRKRQFEDLLGGCLFMLLATGILWAWSATGFLTPTPARELGRFLAAGSSLSLRELCQIQDEDYWDSLQLSAARTRNAEPDEAWRAVHSMEVLRRERSAVVRQWQDMSFKNRH